MKRTFRQVTLVLFVVLMAAALFSCGEGHTHTPVTVRENESREYCDAEGTYDEVIYCSECLIEIERTTKTLPRGEHVMEGNECKNCGFLSYSEGLSYIVNDFGTYTVTSLGSCIDKTVAIPPEYHGTRVTAIGDYAFEAEDITGIVLSEYITDIGDGAFSKCSSLTRVELPLGIESVGKSAFSGCSSLTYNEYEGIRYLGSKENPYTALVKVKNNTVTECRIADGVRCILESAFDGCESLSAIDLPDSLVSIGTRAFRYCESLVSVIIPDGVLCVGAEAFSGCISLDSAHLGEQVTEIEERLFYGCSLLREIYIGGEVRGIGDAAFYGCASLEGISVSEKNGFYKSEGGVLYTRYSGELIRYPAGKNDISYEVLSGTKIIGENSFSDCVYLESVALSDGLVYIKASAFSGCTSLKDILIPSSISGVDVGVFQGCNALSYTEYDGVYYLGNSENPYVVLVKTKDKMHEMVEIADTTRVIYSNAFYNCSLLDALTIPDSVVYIGSFAFQFCTSIKQLQLSNNLKYIGDSAFYNCQGFRYLTIPDSVTYIGESAFRGCMRLREVKIGKGIDTILPFVFSYCTRLTKVTVPEGVVSIESEAFYYCAALESAILPHSLVSLGEKAFYYCESLKTVEFGKNLKTIGAYAFYGCIAMKGITLTDGLEIIMDGAFSHCKALENINIPNSLKCIGEGVFENCTALKYNGYGGAYYLGNSENPYLFLALATGDTVTCILNENVRFISAGAFSQNTLTYNEFGGGNYLGTVENPYFIFVGIKAKTLTEITIHTDTQIIIAGAFSGGSLLEKVTVGENIREIGFAAFSPLSSLESVVFADADGFAAYDSYYGVFENIDAEALASPLRAAKYLTGKYCEFEWKKA